VGSATDGDVQSDGQHQFFENLTVFALLDGISLGADHFHTQSLERPGAVQLHGRIQRCLAAERRQQNQLAGGA